MSRTARLGSSARVGETLVSMFEEASSSWSLPIDLAKMLLQGRVTNK